MIDKNILLGKVQTHLTQLEQNFLVHQEVVTDFKRLQEKSIESGFNLQIISAYRTFERQLVIWNEKALGLRKVLDDEGDEININELNPEELLFAILRFSAIPGTSRHHWGSDLDIYDANAMDRKEVELILKECEHGGACAPMHQWLSNIIDSNESFNFYRPYTKPLGGVAPEPWHISYRPISEMYMKDFSYKLFKEHIESIDIELKSQILNNAKEIFERFIKE